MGIWLNLLTMIKYNMYGDPIRRVRHCATGPVGSVDGFGFYWYLFGKSHRYYGPSDRFYTRVAWHIHGEKIKDECDSNH